MTANLSEAMVGADLSEPCIDRWGYRRGDFAD